MVSDVTGIDTGGMKLGIMDKLKDGGAFVAGATIGGASTAFVRNAVNAGSNIKNKWGETKGFRKKAGLLTGGVVSTFAGGVSGGVRAGKAGMKAGNISDMKSAAAKGASDAVDARDRRAAYKASHGGKPTGVIMGHVGDAFDTAKRWAGINNIQALQEENASIDRVSGGVDKVIDSAKDTIKSQFLAKGKSFTFGVKGQDGKYGISFSPDTYRKISDLKDRAATTGMAQSLQGIVSASELAAHKAATGRNEYTADEIQRIFGKYENDYAKEVANTAFLSAKSYDKLLYTTDSLGNKTRNISYDEEAAFAAVRSSAEAARHELERSVSSGVIAQANEIASSIANEKTIKTGTVVKPDLINIETLKNSDLKVNGDSALDKLGTAAKIVKNKNNEEISKLAQKENDKK